MDIKTAIRLASRRYLAPTVVVLLVIGGGLGIGIKDLIFEYRQLDEKRHKLEEDRKALADERIASERNRADVAKISLQKQFEIEKREFILQQLEVKYKEDITLLQSQAKEYQNAFGKLQEDRSAVSESQRVKDAEEKVQKLMSEFSELGVNLNDPIYCDDDESKRRYNTAKAKYTEIYTNAEASGLIKRFSNFLISNSQRSISSCRIKKISDR